VASSHLQTLQKAAPSEGEMSFTDEDLKELKEYIEEAGDSCDIRGYQVNALLARLEAAERMYLIIESKMSIPEKQQEHIIEAWRKACGK
jgi:hypothetical protein